MADHLVAYLIALLVDLTNCIFTEVFILYLAHGIVKLRIKRFAQRFDFFYTQLFQSILELMKDHFHAFFKVLVAALSIQRPLEVVNHA